MNETGMGRIFLKEKFEDIKRAIRIRKSKKKDSTMAKRKSTKGQTKIYKTLDRNIKIE
jgi:hypothetical protein